MGNSRINRLAVTAVLGGVLAVAMNCRPSTQVTFDISTDVPCAQISGTVITVGAEGETERASPATVTTVCRQDGTVGAIGTYAVAPRRADAVASFKVAVAVTDGINAETDCTAAKKYAGCIVARRRISFVPQRGLVVPVQLWLVCKDVMCDENSTCNRAGKCVSSLVDSSQCDSQGVCKTLATTPGSGLPCQGAGTRDASVCTGDDSWCVVGSDGTRTCANSPGAGQSYLCRNSLDCGPNLYCVAGQGNVLGHCVTTLSPGDTELCTLGQQPTPCANPLACDVDAGLELLSCSALAVKPVDGGPEGTGLRCPRESRLHCSGETPYCDELSGTPHCVADGGSQCWYSEDCELYRQRPDGGRADAGAFDAGPRQFCFAGTNAQYPNMCQTAATNANPVALCNPAVVPNGDCPLGTICDGTFYGKKACRACPAGTADCDGQLANGCEVNVDSDLNNCGACGRVCGAVPNGEPSCQSGQCRVLTCDAGWNDCDTSFSNGCEMKPAGSCIPLLSSDPLCKQGTLTCNGGFIRPVCNPTGLIFDAGTACGNGGTCDENGVCQCQVGTPVNTPCGLDSVCAADHRCVRSKFWDRQTDCSSSLSGDQICQAKGFTRATSAYGYTWSECGGPNYITQVRADECFVFDANRTRCLDWSPGVACNGVPLTATRFGVSLRELGDGGGAYPFTLQEFWSRGCNGWFPGISIRVVCEF